MDRLKIFACVSEPYEQMLNGFFLPSIPPDCLPVLRFFSAGPQRFRAGQWHRATEKKLGLVLDALAKEPEGSIFVMSDVDIQFFSPFAADVRKLMGGGYDILCMHDRSSWLAPSISTLCSGFMVIRVCDDSRCFFEDARARMKSRNSPEYDDQVAIREVIASRSSPVRAGILPLRYWTHGTDTPPWSRGMSVDPPLNIVLHHANWIVNHETKIDQLKAVREIVESRR
jgi:hypothetical protein